MKKHAKIITLVLSLALVIGAVIAVGVNAEAAAPQVVSKNVKVDGNFCLMFAVDPATVAGDSVTLKVYDKAPAEGVETVQTITLAKTDLTKIDYDKDGVENEDMIVFETKGVSAKDIADVWYYTVESDGAVSEAATYSVREYAFERLYGDNKIAAEDDYGVRQKKFYLSILEVGSTAQDLLVNTKLEAEGKAPERLANEYSYASIINGSFGDTTQKFVEIGDTLTLTANAGVPAWQVITYGTNGEVLSKKGVLLGETVTVAGNTVVIPDPTFGTTVGKYFEQIGDEAYAFEGASPWGTAGLATYYKLTGSDSVTNTGYGYRIYEEMDGHGKVLGMGKEANDECQPAIYMPVVDKANGEGNVLVFEADVQLRKGEMTFYSSEIANNQASSNAILITWQAAAFNNLHNASVASGDRLLGDSLYMIDTDTTTLTDLKGGDGLKPQKYSANEAVMEFGKWYKLTLEYYFDCHKAIVYLDGDVLVTYNLAETANLELLAKINSVGFASMWRLRQSEFVVDNVFSGKIVKDYPLN